MNTVIFLWFLEHCHVLDLFGKIPCLFIYFYFKNLQRFYLFYST